MGLAGGGGGPVCPPGVRAEVAPPKGLQVLPCREALKIAVQISEDDGTVICLRLPPASTLRQGW
eukprot:1856021-Alexandrium_andersonii.AAC.1